MEGCRLAPRSTLLSVVFVSGSALGTPDGSTRSTCTVSTCRSAIVGETDTGELRLSRSRVTVVLTAVPVARAIREKTH